MNYAASLFLIACGFTGPLMRWYDTIKAFPRRDVAPLASCCVGGQEADINIRFTGVTRQLIGTPSLGRTYEGSDATKPLYLPAALITSSL